MNPQPPMFLNAYEYDSWKTSFESFIHSYDSELWDCFIGYHHPTVGGSFPANAQQKADKEKKAYAILKMGIPQVVFSCFRSRTTTFELWSAIEHRYGKKDQLTAKVSEKSVIDNEDEVNALKSQILHMEKERDEMRSKIDQMTERIAELENQQKQAVKLQVDYDLALKTVEDLRVQCTQASQIKTPRANVPRKVYPVKSSKSFSRRRSQFTNYSLQKSKRCTSTGTFSDDNSTQRSFKYSRKQMLDFASQSSDMTLKDVFIPFSLRKGFSPLVPRQIFRNETPGFSFRWNSMSLDQIDSTYKWFSNLSKSISTVIKWVPKVVQQ